jgi:hypothetical protein
MTALNKHKNLKRYDVRYFEDQIEFFNQLKERNKNPADFIRRAIDAAILKEKG